MQIVSYRQFAWNVKAYFLAKNKKKYQSVKLAQRVIMVKYHGPSYTE